MPHRFYAPELIESGSVTLVEAEAHHLIHVLRQKTDDVVEVFNGQGLVATCRISSIRKRDASLEILTSRLDSVASLELTLATAIPKGDRIDWLIEKATELGVRRLIPLVTERSVVDPRASKLDKLRMTVITACKQSGRNNLMEITPVTAWADLLQSIVPAHRFLIADPHGSELIQSTSCLESAKRPIVVAIGPEGGFSDGEIRSAIATGAESVSLGKYILRIETAGLALASRMLI